MATDRNRELRRRSFVRSKRWSISADGWYLKHHGVFVLVREEADRRHRAGLFRDREWAWMPDAFRSDHDARASVFAAVEEVAAELKAARPLKVVVHAPKGEEFTGGDIDLSEWPDLSDDPVTPELLAAVNEADAELETETVVAVQTWGLPALPIEFPPER